MTGSDDSGSTKILQRTHRRKMTEDLMKLDMTLPSKESRQARINEVKERILEKKLAHFNAA